MTTRRLLLLSLLENHKRSKLYGRLSQVISRGPRAWRRVWPRPATLSLGEKQRGWPQQALMRLARRQRPRTRTTMGVAFSCLKKRFLTDGGASLNCGTTTRILGRIPFALCDTVRFMPKPSELFIALHFPLPLQTN